MKNTLLQIEFWDVGQGDCSVIRLPSGNLIIIDVGPVGSPLVDWLNERRAPLKIESIILTHNDADHAGALNSIAKQHANHIGAIWMLLDRNRTSAQFQKVLRAVSEGHRQGLYPLQRLERGAILWSHPETRTALRVVHPNFLQNIEASRPNETSAVLVLTSGEKTLVAWPGDLELLRTAEVLGNIDAQLLVGPHHGGPSDYPTRTFRKTNRALAGLKMSEIRKAVMALSPERSFISVGTNNPFHHPRPGYLRLLSREGSKIACSELTLCCDRRNVQARRHVLPGSSLIGLRPPRSGVSCRGAMRLFLQDGCLVPDEWEQEHQTRVRSLLRPQCVRRDTNLLDAPIGLDQPSNASAHS